MNRKFLVALALCSTASALPALADNSSGNLTDQTAAMSISQPPRDEMVQLRPAIAQPRVDVRPGLQQVTGVDEVRRPRRFGLPGLFHINVR